ncbi:MAG: cytochrome c, partial [Candidatus Hydrogenedentota bacterium]
MNSRISPIISPPAKRRVYAQKLMIILCAPFIFCCALAHADDTKKRVPTFTRDVLPIMQEHCQECHRPNQVAPIMFMTYDQVRPWAKAIRKVTAAKTMPPFHAIGPLGKFENDLRMTEGEIQTIVRWVDGGAPRGAPQDAPAPRNWTDGQWEIENPDLVIEYPTYTVKEGGEDEFVMFYSPYTFPEDTWLESIEFRPADRRFVHHAGLFAIDGNVDIPKSGTWSSTADKVNDFTDEHSDESFQQATKHLLTQNYLFTWLPGFGAKKLSSGQAIKIAKGES